MGGWFRTGRRGDQWHSSTARASASCRTGSTRASSPIAWLEAQLAIRVAVERVYPNCNRYVHRYELSERSRFVPRDGFSAPEPGWKRSDWARDVVPKRK